MKRLLFALISIVMVASVAVAQTAIPTAAPGSLQLSCQATSIKAYAKAISTVGANLIKTSCPHCDKIKVSVQLRPAKSAKTAVAADTIITSGDLSFTTPPTPVPTVAGTPATEVPPAATDGILSLSKTSLNTVDCNVTTSGKIVAKFKIGKVRYKREYTITGLPVEGTRK